MRIRAEDGAGADVGFLENAAGTNEHACVDLGVANHGERADVAGGADARAAENLHGRFDDGVGGDFDFVIDYARCGREDGDTFGHELLALLHADLVIDGCEFGERVGAENFVRVFRFPDYDALFGTAKDTCHIGEVVLAVGIGGGKFLDVREQLGQSEDVEAGIDFVNCLLGGGGGFFFDDGFDFGAAIIFADDAAVAGGVVKVGAEQGEGGLLVEVEIEQAGDGLRRDLWGIAGENDDVVVGGECGLGDHESVARAALVGLQDEVDTGMRDDRADAFGFVADDDEDVRRRYDTRGRRDNPG